MKNFLATAVAVAALVGGGAASAQNWAGFYAGGLLSYGSNDIDWTEASSPSLGAFSGNFNNTGFGGFAGYNWQNGVMVFGVEVDAQKLNGDGSYTGVPGPGSMEAQLNWAAGIRGRVGQDSGTALPYVFLGATWAEAEVNSVGFSTQTQTHTGVSVGVGVDVMVGTNAFVRAEFSHTRLGEESYEFCGPGCPADISFDRNAVTIGAGLRF